MSIAASAKFKSILPSQQLLGAVLKIVGRPALQAGPPTCHADKGPTRTLHFALKRRYDR